MGGDFSFTKYFIGDVAQGKAVSELLAHIHERSVENGLLPVADSREAHFVLLVATGSERWLHVNSKGHYLPIDTNDYTPIVHELSHWKESISFWAEPQDSYTLRRYVKGKLTAKYANLNAGNRFTTMEAAEEWLPKYEEWSDVLAPGISEAQFYQYLPAPVNEDMPEPTFSIPASEIPDKLAELFGWDLHLNQVSTDRQTATGPGYRSIAGDFPDEATGIVTYIRCYAHPEPKGQYSRHWKQ